jgi:hypothetical protein
MRRLIRLIPIIALTTACGLYLPPQTPPVVTPPVTPIEQPPAQVDALLIIVRVYNELLKRQPDTYGIDYYGTRLRSGEMTEATMRAHVMASAEYKALHAPAPEIAAVPRLVVKGKQFYDGDTGALYIPRWVSGLTLLARTPEQQEAFLAWAQKTGFNGVRIFAGALTWAGQTPESARAALTPFLDRAARHSLTVEVTALTDTGTGYDAKQHLIGIVDRLAGRRGVVLELANEIGHGTQSADITPERMRAWGIEIVRPRGIIWSVGATLESDEPINGVYAGHGGDYSTAHLDRGRPTWNQVRRVREIYAIAEVHGAPAVNNEPIGCSEPGQSGQRWQDPAMFFALGALDRAFGVGGVHHSQAGLMAELPGPVQTACATSYVAAHRAIDAVLPGQVGSYRNVGHDGSPLTSARFVEGGSGDGVVRAYSFIAGDRGVVVLVGFKGDAALQWADGWRVVRTVDSRTAHDGRQIMVVEISR